MDADKEKYLVEALGGCWHEWGWNQARTHLVCTKCGSVEVIPNFSKWEGFGWLWERARKQLWWGAFVTKHSGVYKSLSTVWPGIKNAEIAYDSTWQFIPLIDPLQFADELYKFLIEGGAK